MKKSYLALPAVLLLGACANTPIAHVGFPEPTVLKGEVHSFTDDGFILKDVSGKIKIETEGMDAKKHLSVGEPITVKGVLDEDDSVGKDYVVAEEFDAYSIIKAGGKEFMLVPYQAK